MAADREQLYTALRNADAAGDTAAAKKLADYIRSLPAEAAPAPDVSRAESAYRGAVQGASLNFGDEVSAAIGAGAYGVAKGVRAVLPGGVPEDSPGVVEVYRSIRDQLRAENAEAQQANPGTYLASEIVGGVASPVPFGKGRALVQGAKIGGAFAAGGSEADLTQGEVGEFAQDVATGAATGAVVAKGAEAVLRGGSRLLGSFTQRAEGRALLARDVEAYDAAVAKLPEERAAVKAENAAAKDAAKLENAAAKEKFRADTAAAKAEAKGATRTLQAEAQAAERVETLKNPLIRTGLEGKQKTLGGGPRAKARAQALVDEPVPGDPTKKLVDEADKLNVDQRLELATGLRRQVGAELGAIRQELAAQPEAQVSAEFLKQQFRRAFAELPTEVQAKAIEQLDGLVGAVAKEGYVPAAALRKLIEDAEGFAKFGTPNLEAALGNARGRVFQSARAVMVAREGELVSKLLPEARAAAYTEALRKYAVYSDFEMGSKVFFDRFYKGRPTVRVPKAAPVEPVAPRAVGRPTPRAPELKPEPAAPEFPGGPERLAQGRALLEPKASMVGRAIAGELGARAGSFLPVPGAAYAGARAGEALAARWARWTTPLTAAQLGARVQKLERLRPMMERAIQEGPEAVARLHAQLMARSPDYRKAYEAGD